MVRKIWIRYLSVAPKPDLRRSALQRWALPLTRQEVQTPWTPTLASSGAPRFLLKIDFRAKKIAGRNYFSLPAIFDYSFSALSESHAAR